jgi:hypothetical protein
MKTKQYKTQTTHLFLALTAALFTAFVCNAQVKINSSGYAGIGITGSTTPTTAEMREHIIGTNGTPATSGTSQLGSLRLQGVSSNVVLDMGLKYGGAFDLKGAYLQATNRSDLSFDYDIALNPNGGNIGIGILFPSYQLHLSTNSAGKPTSSTWSVTSDIRTKTNVHSYPHGLDLVRRVQLVSYQYNGVANTPAGENGVGVIAQDFQQIFPNSIKPFTVTDSSGSGEPYLGVDLHELFIANVGAVKQLDSIVSAKDSLLKIKTDSMLTIISKQDSINAALQNQLNQLLDQINSCCSNGGTRSKQSSTNDVQSFGQTTVKLTDVQSIILEQNMPNPFNEQTTINYYLPDGTGKAQLLFYNAQGRLIQSTDLIQKGKGLVNVFASDLSNGTYTYTLVVDGKIIETKKMVKQ